ncbi:MAG TPA: hypothetical protein VFL12_09250 [Thermoanaerobaculia bacterium]|nr:hypothetical protein [Thermoanaerobaculia bacterium]
MELELPRGSGTGESEPPLFSVMGGGPLGDLLQRAHLVAEELQLLPRRIAIAIAITWIPVAVLSAVAGRAFPGAVKIPFFVDIDVQARLLIALPLLLAAEVVAYQRLGRVVPSFIRRGLIRDADRSKFDAIVESIRRARESKVAEILLLVFVYGFGVRYLWLTHLVIPGETWYAVQSGAGRHLTAAGWWYALVSLPLWQFLLVRWYYRLILWAILLFRISRLDLQLMPLHPDRCGGLGFLTTATRGFSTLLLVHGTLVAGTLANRIYYQGAKLSSFKSDIGIFVAIMLVIVLGPLIVFMPSLTRLRRRGLFEYGGVAIDYVRDFDRKWLRGGNRQNEPLLGTPDIQSLADLANSFEVIVRIQPLPFARSLVIELAIAALLPIAPLMLTMIPLEEAFGQMIKIIF